ncbi:MAG: NAD(P)H-dependent glycerol-3-phosphate dehydrogenase [Verrucomicrobiota bacterium]
MKITVLGDGAWGTTLAILAHNQGYDVTLWGYFADYIQQMREQKENTQFLPGVDLPDGLRLTSEFEEALADTSLIIVAVPVKYLASVFSELAAGLIPADAIVVNVSKGVDVDTLRRPGEIIKEKLGDDILYAALSGPSHAEEVARRLPTAVAAGSDTPMVAQKVQKILTTDFFRIYTSPDVIGVELGGALKNVFAVAAGICDGMGFGDNSKAALITRCIPEMSRLGRQLGGNPSTFAGLSGVGDLIVTCTSRHSRNRYVGEALGRGETLPDIEASMGLVVAEGVKTAQSLYQLARRLGVDTPVIDEVYNVLYEQKAPQKAAHDLMTRELKEEDQEV